MIRTIQNKFEQAPPLLRRIAELLLLGLLVVLSSPFFNMLAEVINEDIDTYSDSINLPLLGLLFLVVPLAGYAVVGEKIRRVRVQRQGVVPRESITEYWKGVPAFFFFNGQLILTILGVFFITTYAMEQGIGIAPVIVLLSLSTLGHIPGLFRITRVWTRKDKLKPGSMARLPEPVLTLLLFGWKLFGLGAVWNGVGRGVFDFSDPCIEEILIGAAGGVFLFALFYFPWRFPFMLFDQLRSSTMNKPLAEVGSLLLLFLMVYIPLALSM